MKSGRKRAAPAPPVKRLPPPVDEEKAWWTEEREKALDMLFSGASKAKIARELKKNRETIVLWTQNPWFSAKLQERLGSHVAETRVRRLRQTTLFADKSAAKLATAYNKADSRDPERRAEGLVEIGLFSDQFRKWREQERADFGDDVRKTRSEVLVAGGLEVKSTQVSLVTFLERKLDDGAIDVSALQQDGDPVHLLSSVVQQALLASPDVLEEMMEEDKAALAEARKRK